MLYSVVFPAVLWAVHSTVFPTDFLQYICSILCSTHHVVRWRETHWLDEVIKLRPLTEPQQGNVVVIVVGLEVWVEDDSVH